MAKSKVNFKTTPGELRWVFLQPGGIDASMNKDGSKMVKQATIVFKDDSKELKQLQTELDDLWEHFKAENNIKQKAYKSNGIKVLKDADTKEPIGESALIFKTGASIVKPNGTSVDTIVPIYDARGLDITPKMEGKLIGNGSIGIIHGSAALYEFGGTYGITLYLKAIQLLKFVEFKLTDVEIDDLSIEYPDAFGESFEF